jgi:EAL domain-containing protein (putative c-di-GMP-specific phosphodiesterase class I)
MALRAEGVETEAQAALLERLRCDEFQGYLTSMPVPPQAHARLRPAEFFQVRPYFQYRRGLP